MSVPILATKLYIPPPRTNVVLRPRLTQRLNEGLSRKLTLVAAPAGFGKTTLISKWVSDGEHPVAWLSLDEGDNDPVRFLAYLSAALQKMAGFRLAVADLGEGREILQAPQSLPRELFLTTLLNDMAAVPDHFILVLDDYHVIDAKSIDHALLFLLEHLPPQMHMVILTRREPNLPLARLRVRDQLVNLGAADLRFTSLEAAEFLNQVMGLNLSQKDIAALEARTEGWIAGLQLAALSLQGQGDTTGFVHAFTGSHRFVLDYLVEEVLQRQPQAVSDFLLQTAVLDKLSGPLCDAVTGRDDGKALLDVLDRGNLFVIPLDDQRQWYRYHHLFSDVLQVRLLEEQPDQIPGLHLRASLWYEKHGLLADAIRHALAAPDFERAADLIEGVWSAMDVRMESVTWIGWAKTLPDSLIRARPVLSVGYAWALLENGEIEACEARLQDAERWLDPALDQPKRGETLGNEMVVVDKEEFRLLPATIATARTYRALALDDVRGSVMYAQQAFKLTSKEDYVRRMQATTLLGLALYASGDLEAAIRCLTDFQSDTLKSGDILAAMGVTFILAEIKASQGRLHEAVRAYKQALELIASQDGPIPAGAADFHRGISELYCEQGDLEAAARHLETSKELGKHALLMGGEHRLCIAEARIKQSQGDLAGALDLLDEAQRLYVRGPLPDVRPIAALRAQIWIAQGRLPDARLWADEQGLSSHDDLSYMREFEHITLARLLIARYQHEQTDSPIYEALGLLERLLHSAEESKRTGRVIEILVVQALAHAAQGETSLALASLKRALTLAKPQGYIAVFVNEGLPMAALLQEAAKRDPTANDVRQLQAALGQVEAKTAVTQPLTEPLSERELEVLAWLITDLNGPEIARELTISLSTMRTHTQNIYAKLGVNNRRAAVRRAEELDLL